MSEDNEDAGIIEVTRGSVIDLTSGRRGKEGGALVEDVAEKKKKSKPRSAGTFCENKKHDPDETSPYTPESRMEVMVAINQQFEN